MVGEIILFVFSTSSSHMITYTPSPSHCLSFSLLSLFLTVSFWLWLEQPPLWPRAMPVSNFFSPVLFILSFSLPSILPDPHCLFGLSLSLLPPFTFLQTLSSPSTHPSKCTSSLFHPNCSSLWTLQLCCSALRKCEYLQFCVFEKPLVGERFSSLQLCIYCMCELACACVCVCRHKPHDCVCGWIHAHGFLCLSVCACAYLCAWGWFVQSNPDYTHLPVSHFRRKGRQGMGEEEGEREKREERCSATTANTLQMNNRVRSVIPPRRLLHWQAGGSSSILVWKQLRASTQPARGLHSLSEEQALSSYIPTHLHCF